MSCEANKAVIRSWIAEGWNGGDVDGAAERYYADDYCMHDPAVPNLPPGVEGFKAYIHTFRDALSGVDVVVTDMLAEGDKVNWHFVLTATHCGPLLGIPATGNRVSVTGMLISRIAGGKVAEEWINRDDLGLFQQLGVIPAMA
ncbi:MAG: ester cyclase [Thermomicrobiales bacterium]